MGRTWAWVSEFLWGPEGASTDGALALEQAPAPLEERPRRLPADDEPPSRPAPPPKRGWSQRGQEGVVELRPSQPRLEVKFPRSFDEGRKLADLFKQGTCLIVDLHQLDESSRGGMVRFLCGVSYGLDGRSDRINELTYVFAPRQYDLPHVDAPRAVGEDPLPSFALPL